MAIHYKNGCRDLLVRAFDIYGQRLNGLKMAEFGNQKLKFEPNMGAKRLQQVKPYLEFFGVRHVSFDTNNRSGALPWDLSVPIDSERLYDSTGIALGEFDIVTNFGTSEHVDAPSQLPVFRNAHHLCRFGGLMIHSVPRAGTCEGHGCWKYTGDWFEQLAELQGYRVEYLSEWDKSEHWREKLDVGDEIYVNAIFCKMATTNGRARSFRNGWPGEPVRER